MLILKIFIFIDSVLDCNVHNELLPFLSKVEKIKELALKSFLKTTSFLHENQSDKNCVTFRII